MSKAAIEMMARPDVQEGLSRILRRQQGGVDESAPKRVGRPSDYDPYMVAEAAGMLQMGATDQEVMDAMGISHQTFYRWVNVVPGFGDIINSSKAAAKRVEASLFNRAVGAVQKKTLTTDPEGKVTEKIEHLPPDPRAQHLWLLNRSPDRWRNRTEHELVVPIPDAEISPEEQDTRRLALAAIALMNEAAEQPLTLDAVASYDQPTEADDVDPQDDWGGEPEDLDL